MADEGPAKRAWWQRFTRARPVVITDSERRLHGYIRQGLTDSEIAVREGYGIEDARRRIGALQAKAEARDRRALARWQPAEAVPVGAGRDFPRLPVWAVVLPVVAALAVALLLVRAIQVRSSGGGDDDEPLPVISREYATVIFAGDGAPASRDGKGETASFHEPRGLAFAEDGMLYVVEGFNSCLRRVSPDGEVVTLRETVDTDVGLECETASHLFSAVAVQGQYLYVLGQSIRRVGPGGVERIGSGLFEGEPYGGMVVNPDGMLFLSAPQQHTIRRMVPGGVTSRFAGGSPRGSGRVDGAATSARFRQPRGIAFDKGGNIVVADTGNHSIRRVSPEGFVRTVAGTGQPGSADGFGPAATFDLPWAVAVANDGTIFVADRAGLIRKIGLDGKVSTIADRDATVWAITAARDGSVYIAESDRIVKLTPQP